MGLKQFARAVAREVPSVSRNAARLAMGEAVEQARREERAKATQELFVSEPPSHNLAFQIFDGLWSSTIPGYGFGGANLFHDTRIQWLEEISGGFQGKRVLELGPLEGGHTYMISKGGAASITAIESNSQAFLKCLLVQNALKFKADFLLGDFRPYLDTCTDSYDFLLASGVLYHMTDPVKLIKGMTKVSKSIGIWTHYYDNDIIRNREDLDRKFERTPVTRRIGDRDIVMYKQLYLDALQWKGFTGGTASTSYWMTKDSILGLFKDLGFSVTVGHDQPDHPNGPAITFYASSDGA